METTQKKPVEAFKITGNWEAQAKQLKSKYPQCNPPTDTILLYPLKFPSFAKT
jgi:hypothetical protein